MKTAILKIRINKENIKKEADLIRQTASDEVYRALEKKSDFEVVRMGLIYLAKSGRLLEQIGIHFPRRIEKLPKTS